MTVYVVMISNQDWDDDPYTQISSIFKTKEAAKAYIDRKSPRYRRDYEIEEWVVWD